jgi:Dolichyl-phosphate-mannose-protein mannosyltransferase
MVDSGRQIASNLAMTVSTARRHVSVLNNDRAVAYWALLIGVPLLLAFVAALRVPLTAPMPDYLHDAQQYVAAGHISNTTYPVGFAWLVGLSMQILGVHGPEVLQAVLYVFTVLAVWELARQCGASSRAALGAALVTALYPQLPVSVTKIWDVEFSVLAMVLVLLVTLLLLREGPRPMLALASGLVLGLSLAQRPNMLLLVPLPTWICLRSRASWPRRLGAFAGAALIAAATLITVNTLAHGSFFLSQNGPYNLVQGHNEYSIRVMLDDLSCEPSVAMILKADGMPSQGFNEADPALQRYFSHRARVFIQSHPMEEIPITAVKLWTLFRPNSRMHRGLSGVGLLVIAMSLIFPVWFFLLIRRAKRTGLNAVDWMFVSATVLYVLPFLITSSDPRYQIPIEICMLSHIAAMLSKGAETGRTITHSAA